jgi:hypothetical protein
VTGVQTCALPILEGKEQYCVEISNRFADLENLDTEVNINRGWETVRENIKTSVKESLGCYELKKHKPWFDEGCSKLLEQRKQATLQWLQDPNLNIFGSNTHLFLLHMIETKINRLRHSMMPSAKFVSFEQIRRVGVDCSVISYLSVQL